VARRRVPRLVQRARRCLRRPRHRLHLCLVGRSAALLRPLAEAIGRYVKSAAKIHGDDIPIPVLSPGNGKTKIARLWTYVRDDRPWGSTDPPAVWFRYSPDRKGERPLAHLKDYHGILQADGYAGFNRLY